MTTKAKEKLVQFPAAKTDIQKQIKLIVFRIEEELVRYDWPWEALAARAGLSLSTVLRFRYRQYHDSPRLSTVLKIAKAVGLTISLKEGKKVSIRRAG